MDMRGVAIRLALRDFFVFRLRAGEKTPVAKGWQNEATDCPIAARRLFTGSNGDSTAHNVGVMARGLVIVDVDPPGDVHGSVDGFKSFEGFGWHGETFTVETPSGGRHYYFRKPEGVDFTQRDPAPGVQVRVDGSGYVVGPGSRTRQIKGKQAAGTYEILCDVDPVELPDCIAEHLTIAGATEHHSETEYAGDWDAPADIKWCWEYIKHHAPEAMKGTRGRTGLEIAHKLGDRAISRDLALEMLQWWHEHKCTPNDDDTNQMAHVLNSAYSNRRKAIGSECHIPPEPATEIMEEIARTSADGLGVADEEKQQADAAYAEFCGHVTDLGMDDESELQYMPPEDWLIPGKLIRGNTSGLISPPGVGKSTLTLQWAAALAVGDGAFAGLDTLVDQKPVKSLVVGIEDPVVIMRKRLGGMLKGFGIPFTQVRPFVKLISGTDVPIKLLEKEKRASFLKATRQLEAMKRYIIENEISAIFLDPLVELHDGEENDNGEMRRVMDKLRELARETNAAVLLVHHTRKPAQGSAESYVGDMSAGRGASSISGSLRQMATLFGMLPKDAEALGISEESRHDYIRYDDAKNSWHEMSRFPTWYKREKVALGNGEMAPILRPVKLSVTDNESSQLLAEEIAELLERDKPTPLNTIVKRLHERELYPDTKPGTLRARIRTLMTTAKVMLTTRGQLLFKSKGPTGGDITLTDPQDEETTLVEDCYA